MPTLSTSGHFPGGDAGNIAIKLCLSSKKHSENSTILIQGTIEENTILSEVNLSMRIDDWLSLHARGGDGYDGLIAKDGADGANGCNGLDATQYSCGGNGGIGQDGQHGDAGTNGGPAGSGGNVTVTVMHHELALLDAINYIDVSPGNPGKPGRHGRGGRGGKGGMGGNPFCWEEPYEQERPKHWMDEYGNSHSAVVRETHYRYHYSSGGVNGQNGRDGGCHVYALYPGAEGKHGKITFQVISQYENKVGNNQQVIKNYAQIYKLVTENIQFRSQVQSGIWEPGDQVTAYYAVENTTSYMCSPAESMALILAENPYIKLLQAGVVEGNIEPGESKNNFDAPMIFVINEPSEQQIKHLPYVREVEVKVSANNFLLQRPFQFSTTKNFLKIQFPIVLDLINPNNATKSTNSTNSLFSIAEGETYTLQAMVKNIGSKKLGESVGRTVLIKIIDVEHKALLYSENVAFIDSQGKQQISHIVEFSPNNQFGDQKKYEISVYLQSLLSHQSLLLIQKHTIIGQLSPRYLPGEYAFIMVIGHDTTKLELDYWRKFLRNLSQKEPGIWNQSYYNQLVLDGTPNLLENARNGAIVFLSALADEKFQLSQMQLLKAAQNYGVSLISVGSQCLVKLSTSDDVVEWSESKKNYSSLSALIQALIKETAGETIYIHQLSQELPKSWFGYITQTVESVMALVSEQLKNVFPNRVYHIKSKSDGDNCVQIDIRRMMNKSDQNIHLLGLSDKVKNALRQAKNDKNSLTEIECQTIQALFFKQKLDLFIQKSNPYHQAIACSMLSDLLTEQNIVLQSTEYGTWFERLCRKYQRDFSIELCKLQQLVTVFEDLVQQGDLVIGQACVPYLIRMIAELQYHTKQHSTFWTRLFHWFLPQANERVIDCTQLLCHKMAKLIEQTDAIKQEVHRLNVIHDLEVYVQSQQAGSRLKNWLFWYQTPPIDKQELADLTRLIKLYRENLLPAKEKSFQELLNKLKKSAVIKPFEETFKVCF